MKLYNHIPIDESIAVSSLVTVYYLRLPNNYDGMREKLPFYQLIYVDRGEMEYTSGDASFTLRAGQAAITPPDVTRKGRMISDSRAFLGIVSFTSSKPLPDEITAGPAACDNVPTFSLSQRELELMRELLSDGPAMLEPIYGDDTYKGMRPRSDTSPAELAVLSAKLNLLLCMLRSDTAADNQLPAKNTDGDIRLMGRIKEYLTRRVCTEVTISDICREFNISSSRLKRIFRENESCGVIDYFISLKIDRAKSLISEGGMNFTQISERLGFSSLHYFSRVFRQRTGMTPSEYRRTSN